LTSSVAAIFDTWRRKNITMRQIGQIRKSCNSHYSKSKTLAERAAWDFVESDGYPFELLLSILP
jgi:dihydroflavonol-4-reductase